MTYIQKGSNNPNMNNYEHNDVERQDISSSYIEIPLLLQYNQSNNIQIETGILAGYLIDGYYNDSQGRIPKYNESNPFISYDFGALIGFNYKYSKKISLNTRISNSILPIGTEDKRKFLTKGKYNTVLSFTLNYTI